MKQSEAERLAMEEEEEKGVSEESDEEVPSEEIYEESSPKQENPIPSLTRLSDDEEMEWNVDDADESNAEEESAKGDTLGSATAQKELENSNLSYSEKDSVKPDDGIKAKESNENTTTKESNSTVVAEPTSPVIQSTSAQSQSSELLEIGKDGKLVKSKPKLNLMDLFNKAKEKKTSMPSEKKDEKKDQKDEKDEHTNEKIDLQNEPKSESSEDPLFEKEDEETVDENDYEEQQPTAEDYARYKAMMQESSIRITPFDM